MTLSLLPPPRIITFDCYGTLVRWRETLLEVIGKVIDRSGGATGVDPSAVLATFSRLSSGMARETPHRLYKRILREGFAAAFAAHGIAARADDIETVAESIKTMGPHPETRAVLTRLRTRYKLAIFTNSDDDLIVHNIRLLDVPIDHVITAEQARAYKPSRQIFEYGHRKMGVTPADVVHVAQSMVLDMQACHELGMRGVWINRAGETGNPDWLPYEELPDLHRVPELLEV